LVGPVDALCLLGEAAIGPRNGKTTTRVRPHRTFKSPRTLPIPMTDVARLYVTCVWLEAGGAMAIWDKWSTAKKTRAIVCLSILAVMVCYAAIMDLMGT
jgi:hypothetical protein